MPAVKVEVSEDSVDDGNDVRNDDTHTHRREVKNFCFHDILFSMKSYLGSF